VLLLAALAVVALVRVEQVRNRVEILEKASKTRPDAEEALRDLQRKADRLNGEVLALQARSVRVPDVVGLSVREALNWIGVAGFPAAAAPPAGGLDVDAACVVVSQTPEAGQMVQVVTPVRLGIAAPPGAIGANCT
jgi:hypothetical protein